jgi:hypothetical protein
VATTQATSKARAGSKRSYRQARGGGKKTCTEANCKRPYRAKGYCFFHYAKWRRGELHPESHRYKLCSHEECKKPRAVGAYCEQHDKERKGEGKPAAAPAPGAPAPAASPAA